MSDKSKKPKGQNISIRKSSESIPPQTGKFRNLFDEMQQRQNSKPSEKQQKADSRRDTHHRDGSTS